MLLKYLSRKSRRAHDIEDSTPIKVRRRSTALEGYKLNLAPPRFSQPGTMRAHLVISYRFR
jgi:hypothetical protein